MNEYTALASRQLPLYGGTPQRRQSYCKAMALKEGEKTVVIVNVDVCGLTD